MSTTVTPPAEQAVEIQFDPKAFMAKQNETQQAKLTGKEPAKAADKPADANAGKPATEAAKTAEGATTGEAAHEENQGPRMSRSQRREHNRLLTELGEARGRAKALEELLSKGGTLAPTAAGGKQEAAATADPEPKQADFPKYEDYLDTRTRWTVRQEAAKTLNEGKAASEQETALRTQIQAAETKAVEDIKSLDDWDEVSKAAADEGPEFIPAEHPNLMAMLATSDMRAFVLYHFGKHPAELEKMLELSKTPTEQIRQFHRLEGRVERLYAKDSAAQAGDKTEDKTKVESKDRTKAPEKAEQAREATADKPAKPKPSSEVAARGSSSAPEEPAVGSAAWMMRRNQSQYAK